MPTTTLSKSAAKADEVTGKRYHVKLRERLLFAGALGHQIQHPLMNLDMLIERYANLRDRFVVCAEQLFLASSDPSGA